MSVHRIVFVMVLLLAGCSDDNPSSRTSEAAAPPPVTSAAQPAAMDRGLSADVAEIEPTPTVESTPEPAATPVPIVDAEPVTVAAGEPKEHIVKGVVTQWSPMILFIEPGDTVVFRQMAGHDSQTMEGLFPAGATPWRSQLGQEGFSIRPEVPGAYIYKCNPHASTGMIGAIVVGAVPPANLAELESSPLNKGMTGRAIRKLKQALAETP